MYASYVNLTMRYSTVILFKVLVINIDLQKTPIDFIAVSAHKFHGPKGVGFAYIRKNSGLKASIYGGQQNEV